MKIIVAADERNGIGKDGGLPWRCPEDMARFKTLTTNGVVIMGRKTWDSLTPAFRPLPGRHNIVVSHRSQSVDGAYGVIGGLGNLHWAYHCNPPKSRPAKGTIEWVIGGGQIYKEALDLGLVDEIYLTRIEGDYGCDVRWPGVPDGWTRVEAAPFPEHMRGLLEVENSWARSRSTGVCYRFERWVKP